MSYPDEELIKDIKDLALKHAVLNALKHQGKADVKAVIGKVFSENPKLKDHRSLVLNLVQEAVSQVNAMAYEEISVLASRLGLEVGGKRVELKKVLPPLPNADKYPRIKVRFAPNPDSAMHIGNARAAILNDEYAKMYGGTYLLRFEDTSPSIKPPLYDPKRGIDAYQMIREDLSWLGVKWHEEVIQSDRLEIYYRYAEKLIEDGSAYVCTCSPDQWRILVKASQPCPCRELPTEDHLERWKNMLEGRYKPGEAVVRIKTDLTHPNPAVRDWPALRIDLKPHPRKGSKYRVWPLYNFAAAIDDHELGITHILRGKEHEINTIRQRYLYAHLGWQYPEVIHYGRLKIEGGVLSKSKIRNGVEKGIYIGWDDPRLGTLKALRRRGFLPESIRQMIIDVGVKPVEATISWDNLCAINRKLLDPLANRFFFVEEPVKLTIKNAPIGFSVEIPYHPSFPDRGIRRFSIPSAEITFLVSSKDKGLLRPGSRLRLMHLFNVQVNESLSEDEYVGSFISFDVEEAKRLSLPIIHWVYERESVKAQILMPAEDKMILHGFCEKSCIELKPNSLVQFVRFGFCRIEEVSESLIKAVFAHD